MIGAYDFASGPSADETSVIEVRDRSRLRSRVTRMAVVFGTAGVMAALVIASPVRDSFAGHVADASVSGTGAPSVPATEASVSAQQASEPATDAAVEDEAAKQAAQAKAEEEAKRKAEEEAAKRKAAEAEAKRKEEAARLAAASATIAYDKRGLRVAHRCNVAEALDGAGSAWGVEADVREADESGDVKLYQTEDGEFRLSTLLATCKERGQVVILDMKDGSDAALVVGKVRDAGMLANVRFQVTSVDAARRLRELDRNCLVWLLSGSETDEAQALSALGSSSDLFCGINIWGGDMSVEQASSVAGLVHGMTGSVGKPMELCLYSSDSADDVYGMDEAFADAGVNLLMCGKVYLVP